jgi:hypothetical protein
VRDALARVLVAGEDQLQAEARSCDLAALPAFLARLEEARAIVLGRLITSATAPPPSPAGGRWMTLKEAGEVLSVNPKWLWRRRRELPFIRAIDGRRWRAGERELRAWMERRT